jgi:hypothetical protein
MPPPRDPLVAIRVSATTSVRVGQPGEVRLVFDAAAGIDGLSAATTARAAHR